MCGRYTLTEDLKEFADRLALRYDPRTHNPRFNICPSQQVPVILNDGTGKTTQARWGLIPSWAKDPKIGNQLANARAEGIDSKPSFRTPFEKRRCLVLADGFYEWQKRDPGLPKQPYYFRLRSKEVFAFAGLWDVWKYQDVKEVVTCCLITTEANRLVEKVHHRMPVILEERWYQTWLGDATPDKLLALLRPLPAVQMEAFAVSVAVNKPTNDTPDVLKQMGPVVR